MESRRIILVKLCSHNWKLTTSENNDLICFKKYVRLDFPKLILVGIVTPNGIQAVMYIKTTHQSRILHFYLFSHVGIQVYNNYINYIK